MLEVKIEKDSVKVNASGDIREITSQLMAVITGIHTQLKHANPVLAAAFRAVVTKTVVAPDSPLWNDSEHHTGVAIIKDKKQGDSHEK